jgi:hypothetical protein
MKNINEAVVGRIVQDELKMPQKTPKSEKVEQSQETASQRILLEEYRFLQNRFISNREEGVTRLNFFITASSVVLGAVLVFGSNDSVVPASYFRWILLAILGVLSFLAFEIYNFLIYRDILGDRCERGMARIRRYFIHMDPEIEGYFVNRVIDIPTSYVVWKYSNMRRTAQILIGTLLGLFAAVASSFFAPILWVLVVIGVVSLSLVYIILEVKALRDLDKVRKSVEKDVKFRMRENAS